MPDDMPRLPESDYESETRPSPPELLDLESTRASAPIDVTRAIPPVTDRGHVQPSAPPGDYMLSGTRERQSTPRKRKQPPRQRSDGGFYLPVWSVALMLILVFAVASGVILLVLSLGGQTAPESGPRFVIVTAAPTIASNQSSVLASPTIPLEINPDSQQQPQSFALEGPTLEPVILSPTPETIAIGKRVTVIDAEDSGLNVRSDAGLDNEVRFIADNGETFTIIGGPTQADSITWWQLQDPTDNSRSGWASASYLQVVTQ